MTGEGRFADLGTPATAVAPLIPDIVNGLGRPTNAVAFDVSYWDKAAENPARVDTVNFISAPLHRQPIQRLITDPITTPPAAQP